jgi:predicted nuclease with TOPRIM domain
MLHYEDWCLLDHILNGRQIFITKRVREVVRRLRDDRDNIKKEFETVVEERDKLFKYWESHSTNQAKLEEAIEEQSRLSDIANEHRNQLIDIRDKINEYVQ